MWSASQNVIFDTPTYLLVAVLFEEAFHSPELFPKA